MGINKVNINTDLQKGAFDELRETIETNRKSFYFVDISNGYKKVLRKYMEACNCIGKTWDVSIEGVSKESFIMNKKRN